MILVCKRLTDLFYDKEEVEKTSWVCDLFMLKDTAFTAVQRDTN